MPAPSLEIPVGSGFRDGGIQGSREHRRHWRRRTPRRLPGASCPERSRACRSGVIGPCQLLLPPVSSRAPVPKMPVPDKREGVVAHDRDTGTRARRSSAVWICIWAPSRIWAVFVTIPREAPAFWTWSCPLVNGGVAGERAVRGGEDLACRSALSSGRMGR